MSADIFDVFDEYPDVVAVPMEQAIQEFRNYVHSIGHVNSQFNRELKEGTSTVESRRAIYKQQDLERKRVELQLFRSIMAAGSTP